MCGLLRFPVGILRSALLLALFASCLHASGQTTTISGTVYDPRTSNALPLPNVLVYVTTGPVAPLPAGAQCLTYSAPSGATSYVYTAVDGTFTLKNVPVHSSYTLVIQAGKWRRQFPTSVGASPVSGLNLHMPSNHLQGDIPMIAVATGAYDGVECVLRAMGIADSEFTDDTGTTNPGGRIHLYQGMGFAGAVISPSTPVETAMTTDAAKLNSYDVVMFPCQGVAYTPPDSAQANLLDFANAGGRVFTTHLSYVWLDPNDYPNNSQFPPVANWHPELTYPTPDPGVATVNTSFTDGATMAQWLQNIGADYQGQPDQIQVSTLRHDIDSVIPPTQSWLTLNDPSDNNPIMQFTFNAPVGAAAGSQCGRVLFNEYHVINLTPGPSSLAFPAECPAGPMTPQEEMLEYALFDLSDFVHQIVVPTLSIEFNPTPLLVKANDTGDQVTISVTNTSTDTAIDPSAALAMKLPAGLTATAINDSTNGWNCTLSTLKCTRTTSISSSVSDPVTLTVSVGSYPLASYAGQITATVSSPTFSNNVVATDPVIFQQKPTVTWPTPAPILYGTPLGPTQLNAVASVPGAFAFTPAAGTILPVGQQTLNAVFTPADQNAYVSVTASVVIKVVPLSPTVGVTASPNPAFVSNPVTFTISLPSPTIPPSGTITFYDGETQVGSSAVVNGAATFSTSSLTMGVHTIAVTYSGDSNYLPATSNAFKETIQDFSIAVAPGSNGSAPVINPGSPASFSLILTPLGGSTMPASLTLGTKGLPPGSSVVFSPASVAADSATTPVTMVVTPPALGASNSVPQPLGKRGWPMALGLLLLPFARRLRRARRWMQLLVLAIAGAAFAAGVSACGSFTYTPQDFSVTVAATSGNLSHTATVKLTVK